MKQGTPKEGEVCGSCLNPDNNFFCGNCALGLKCIEDPQTDILPDLPARCKKASGNIF